MRRLLILMLLIYDPGWICCGEDSTRKTPLDLPSGGRGSDQEDEDTPEVIEFYNNEYEGDAFFFLIDKSGSMHGDQFAILQEEMSSTINSLSHRAEFGIVAFSTIVNPFCNKPVRATVPRKAEAVAWIYSLEASGLTHLLDGALVLLEIAEQSRKAHRIVVVLSDGLPNGPGPEETLAGILEANDDNLPHNTILIGAGPEAEDFMVALADATGGRYSHLSTE